MKKTSLLIITLLIAVQLVAQENHSNLLNSEERIKAIDLLTPIIIGVIGALWTFIQSRIQAANTRAEVYNHFQEKFKEFQSKLPTWINQRDRQGNLSEPQGEKEKAEFNRTLESYWWLVFDEWVVCCRESEFTCKRLWVDYYSKGVLNALERQYFKEAFFRLVKKKNSFLGHDEEFENEIKRLYREKNKKELY